MNKHERQEFRRELAEVKAELAKRIAANAGGQAHIGRERRDYLAEMDAKMGLTPVGAGSVTRSAHELRASVFGDSTKRKESKPAPTARTPAPRAGALYPRATKLTRATALSSAAAELDARMGFAPTAPRIRRTPNLLEISVLD